MASAGYSHSLALKTDGTLWSWGWNDDGQLGNGTKSPSKYPGQIDTGFKMISAGDTFSLAVKNDGTIWTWGDNGYGQLGDGSIVDKITPVLIVLE